MKIIQAFRDDSLKCGFPTREACLNYLRKSYSIHSKLCETIIYTDADGAEYLSRKAPEINIKVIDFEQIDSRFWNLPKLQVQELQTEPYIHVDIDATLFELPNTDKSVITEMLRRNFVMTQFHHLQLSPKPYLPCSGLIGFNDMDLKNKYIKLAIELVRNWPLKFVDFESMWNVEELSLANICEISDFYELPEETFEHLQGGQKK